MNKKYFLLQDQAYYNHHSPAYDLTEVFEVVFSFPGSGGNLQLWQCVSDPAFGEWIAGKLYV